MTRIGENSAQAEIYYACAKEHTTCWKMQLERHKNSLQNFVIEEVRSIV